MHADINLASRPWLPCHYQLAHPVKLFCCPSFGTSANCTDNNCHDIGRFAPRIARSRPLELMHMISYDIGILQSSLAKIN